MLIVTGITLVILVFFAVVPWVIMDKSKWWFFTPLIFFGVAYILFGFGYLIYKVVTKKKTVEIKLNIKDAKLRAVHEMKYDLDNPDNFKINKSRLVRIGEKGADKTPILVLIGIGTEMNQKRVIIINLNNPKQESTSLIDPSEEDKEIEKSIRLIAEHPPEEERTTTEEGVDAFGRPTRIIKTRKPTTFEEKKKEEESKAEEANAM